MTLPTVSTALPTFRATRPTHYNDVKIKFLVKKLENLIDCGPGSISRKPNGETTIQCIGGDQYIFTLSPSETAVLLKKKSLTTQFILMGIEPCIRTFAITSVKSVIKFKKGCPFELVITDSFNHMLRDEGTKLVINTAEEVL